MLFFFFSSCVRFSLFLSCFFFLFQRSGDLNELEADYESKQSDLDVLQNEVVKLEGIVAAISENVRDRKNNSMAIREVAASASYERERDEQDESPRASRPAMRSSSSSAYQYQTHSSSSAASAMPHESSFGATPLHGSPANRLAASAASAALVARRLADEEERQFSHSMSVLSATASAVKAASERSPFRAERASDVQRSLQEQLNELELEVQSIASERRRAAH